MLLSNIQQDFHVVWHRDTKEVQNRRWCRGCISGGGADLRGYPWRLRIHVRTTARGWKHYSLYFSHAKPQHIVSHWCKRWLLSCVLFNSVFNQSERICESSGKKESYPSKDVLNASSWSFAKIFLEEYSQWKKKRQQQLCSLVWRCTLPSLLIQCIFLLSCSPLHIHVPLHGRNHVSSTFFA